MSVNPRPPEPVKPWEPVYTERPSARWPDISKPDTRGGPSWFSRLMRALADRRS